MKSLSLIAGAIAMVANVQAEATQFCDEDLQTIKDFKWDYVFFKTKKDCAIDSYPHVS